MQPGLLMDIDILIFLWIKCLFSSPALPMPVLFAVKRRVAKPCLKGGWVKHPWHLRRTSLDDMMDVLHSSNEFDSWCTWRAQHGYFFPMKYDIRIYFRKVVSRGFYPQSIEFQYQVANTGAQHCWDQQCKWRVTVPLRLVTF